jgi:hypothetical protein
MAMSVATKQTATIPSTMAMIATSLFRRMAMVSPAHGSAPRVLVTTTASGPTPSRPDYASSRTCCIRATAAASIAASVPAAPIAIPTSACASIAERAEAPREQVQRFARKRCLAGRPSQCSHSAVRRAGAALPSDAG